MAVLSPYLLAPGLSRVGSGAEAPAATIPAPLTSPQLSVSSNVGAEARNLEAQINELTSILNRLHPRNSRGRAVYQRRLASLQEQLSGLRSITPGVTPRPADAPLFAGIPLDAGRVSVSDLKLVR